MNRALKRTIAAAVIMALAVAFVPPVWAYRDWDSTPMEVDAYVLRPLGMAATILGAASFLVALPFAVITGTAEEAADQLVVAPYSFTFERPMGFPTTRSKDAGW